MSLNLWNFLKKDKKVPARLSNFREKFYGFQNHNIDYLFCLKFNSKLANLEPEEFVKEILVDKLNIGYLVVGDDFHFGKNGSGDFELLLKLAKKYGFIVENSNSYCLNNKRISSTAIREFLANDNLQEAKNLLGDYFAISGKVSHGDEIGRTIDFPTANINLKRRELPIHGVFAVTVTLPDNNVKYGVANVGERPTVDGKIPRLEVFILDFNGNIYRQLIKVSFVTKLRAEKKFHSLNELKEQIALDELKARQLFGI